MRPPVFAAVDWGTSSFRLWLLDASGTVLNQRQGGCGMSTLKPGDFLAVLEENLGAVSAPPHLPVVICGMAGAAQGWYPAPYLDVPTPLDMLAEHAVRVPDVQRDIRILPGLAQRRVGAEDVMRGEETILLGAVASSGIDGVVCMPGTHSKWANLKSGRVEGFSTAMTGEIFALLSRHSTLSHFIGTERTGHEDSPAFAAAVREAMAYPARILTTLFSIRAMPLLADDASAEQMPARLSGLLIGLELAGRPLVGEGIVTLISGGILVRNYARALEIAGIAFRLLEAGDMARAGLFRAGCRTWNVAAFARH